MRVLGPVVEPTTAGPGGRIADHSHRSPVGRKPVRDDRSRPAITLHRAFQKPECSPEIPPFRGKNLKHFAFVVNRAPQIAGLPVDPHEHLIKVPAPVRIPMTMILALADLRGKQRTEAVPPGQKYSRRINDLGRPTPPKTGALIPKGNIPRCPTYSGGAGRADVGLASRRIVDA